MSFSSAVVRPFHIRSSIKINALLLVRWHYKYYLYCCGVVIFFFIIIIIIINNYKQQTSFVVYEYFICRAICVIEMERFYVYFVDLQIIDPIKKQDKKLFQQNV